MTATDLVMPALGGARVLVLEPDEDGAASLTALLRLSGFDAHATRSGAATLRAVAAAPPCAVVMDYHLPDAEPCGLIRELRAVRNPPAVVVVTGDTDPAHRSAATAAGAVGFFLKPADPQSVVRLLHRLCQQRPG